MSLPRSRTSFAVAFLAVLTLGSSACVKQNLPGVGLVKFDSSAVFGLPKKDNAPLPGFNVPDTISDLNVGGFVGNKDNTKLPDLGPCPPAKLTAFPKTTATPQIIGLPAAGIYKWKRDFLVVRDSTQTPPVLERLGQLLQSRAIRRVEKQSDHQFTYEMLQPDPSHPDLTVITKFRVNTNPEIVLDQDTRNLNTGDVPIDGVPQVSRDLPGTIGFVDVPYENVRLTPVTDAPGIFIESIETKNKDEVLVSSFTPAQPMLILPLDGGIIRSGQTFRSIAISQSDQSVLVNDGIVGRTNRVDACGEIVEGYQVTLRQTLSTDIVGGDVDPAKALSDQETRELTYTFATQLGGLPIGETISFGNVDNSDVGYYGSWTLGGLTPTPLPDGLK
jgi:hypothetical protein